MDTNITLFRGDVVRLYPATHISMSINYSDSAQRGFAGAEITINDWYPPQFDNGSRVFNVNQVESLVRKRHMGPALSIGDQVVLTSDKKRVAGNWTSGMMQAYLGKTVIISAISGVSFNIIVRGYGPGGQFLVSEIEKVLPREDGFIPLLPFIPKVGDFVQLVGKDNIRAGNTAPDGWSTEMLPYLGAVVEVIDSSSSGNFRIRAHTRRDREIRYVLSSALRIATDEDKAKWAIEEKKREDARKEILSKAYLDHRKVGDMAIDIFGLERVMVSKLSGDEFEIVIHFPEVDITNSLKQNHKIRDLFVMFRVYEIGAGQGYLCNIDCLGARTTWTPREIESGYSHSHLPSGIYMPNNWNQFCLGSSDFRLILENTKLNAQEEDWMMIFLSLKNYVSWESLEGGPHCSIRNIGSSGGTGTSRIHESIIITDVMRMMPSIPSDLWEYTPYGFVLNPHNPYVIEFFEKNSTIKTLVVLNESRRVKELQQRFRTTTYNFNGTKYPFNIFQHGSDIKKTEADQKKKQEEEAKKTVEPAVIEAFCKVLEDKIKLFTKNYSYDLLKSKRKDIFAKARILEQA